jgi:hypothetical protein
VRARANAPFARRMCTESSQPDVPLSERLLTFGHRLIATGLVAVTLAGTVFVGQGCWEIYDRNTKRKQLRQQEQQ